MAGAAVRIAVTPRLSPTQRRAAPRAVRVHPRLSPTPRGVAVPAVRVHPRHRRAAGEPLSWPRVAWTLVAVAAVAALRGSGVVPAFGEEATPAARAEVRVQVPAPAAPAAAVLEPCRGRRGPDSALPLLIHCEAAVWHVPGGAAMALAVARCESSMRTTAFNPTGCGGAGCSGLYQQSLRFWRQRAANYGFAERPPTDAVANVVVSLRMAAEKGTWARDWPVCGA